MPKFNFTGPSSDSYNVREQSVRYRTDVVSTETFYYRVQPPYGERKRYTIHVYSCVELMHVDANETPGDTLLAGFRVAGPICRDRCSHDIGGQCRSLLIAVDNIERKVIAFKSDPQSSTTAGKHIRRRQFGITLFSLGVNDSAASQTYQIYRCETELEYLLPLGLLINEKNGSLFLAFHHCPPSDAPQGENVVVAEIEFNQKNHSFRFRLLTSLSANDNFFICYSSMKIKYQGLLYSTIYHFDPRSKTMDRFGYMCADLKRDAMKTFWLAPPKCTCNIEAILGTIREFAIILTRCPCEFVFGKSYSSDVFVAYSFRTGIVHKLKECLDEQMVPHEERFRAIKGADVSIFRKIAECVIRNEMLTLRYFNLLCGTATIYLDIYPNLKKEDQRAGYKCPSCGSVVQKAPKVCRICKQIGAQKYIDTHLGTIRSNHRVTFCNRRCLKNNWLRHKALHSLVADIEK